MKRPIAKLLPRTGLQTSYADAQAVLVRKELVKKVLQRAATLCDKGVRSKQSATEASQREVTAVAAAAAVEDSCARVVGVRIQGKERNYLRVPVETPLVNLTMSQVMDNEVPPSALLPPSMLASFALTHLDSPLL